MTRHDEIQARYCTNIFTAGMQARLPWCEVLNIVLLLFTFFHRQIPDSSNQSVCGQHTERLQSARVVR